MPPSVQGLRGSRLPTEFSAAHKQQLVNRMEKVWKPTEGTNDDELKYTCFYEAQQLGSWPPAKNYIMTTKKHSKQIIANQVTIGGVTEYHTVLRHVYSHVIL